MAEQAETTRFGPESEAVRAHLSIMQDVIRRMAGNSASCKNWCIVLVAAMLVLVARTEQPDYALLALLPTLLFLFLDAYYLALEQGFRKSYEAFVKKLHRNEVELSDIYKVRPVGRARRQIWTSVLSFAVWPFYLVLVIAVGLVWKFDCVKAVVGF